MGNTSQKIDLVATLNRKDLRAVKKALRHRSEFVAINDSWAFVQKVACRFFKAVDTPVALSCYIMLQNNDIAGLISHSVSPHDYEDPHRFADDYACVSFLKKYEGFPKSLRADTKLAAMKSTVASELACEKTNQKLRHFVPSRHTLDMLLYAQGLISDVLQDCPNLEKALGADGIPSYGPGTSSSCKGRYTSVYNKLDSDLHVTYKAAPLAKELLSIVPRLIPQYPDRFTADTDIVGEFCVPYSLMFIPGNRFTTVPKNAKTDRPICVEPHLNMVLQRIYGKVISKRLKRFGIDTEMQHEVNRTLAESCSIDDQMVTIDLSAASDTISVELVRNLLPEDWFDVLNNIRSHFTQYDDCLRENAKFSSMGNGFTFELETLIFWALTCAALHFNNLDRKNNVSVFGDDIIVATPAANTLVDLLTYCGFSLNKEKTFLSGPFKESCGSDFWNGYNVRPYFLKTEVSDIRQLFGLANGIRHYASRRGRNDYSCDRFKGVWSFIVDKIKKIEPNYPIGPKMLGDTVLWASPSEVSANAVIPTMIDGICYSTQILDTGNRIKIKSLSRVLTGALMALNPSKIKLGANFEALPGSPMPNRYRESSNFRNITNVAVPVGTDALIWL